MDKTQKVAMSELHLNPGEIISQVHYTHQPIAVTKHGKPVVILVPVIGTLDGGDDVIGAIRRWLDSLEQPGQVIEDEAIDALQLTGGMPVEEPVDRGGSNKPGGWD